MAASMVDLVAAMDDVLLVFLSFQQWRRRKEGPGRGLRWERRSPNLGKAPRCEIGGGGG